MVDAVDSKSTVEIHAGSNPAFGTIISVLLIFIDLKQIVRKILKINYKF